jgi:regulatory protein
MEEDVKAARAARRLEIRQRALNLLARREHAPSELAAKLRRRGYADDDIAAVCVRLAEENWLSGQRYAQAVVVAKSARGIGPARIRAELAAVAIDDAMIETALADAEVDWVALARAARAKRFGPSLPDDFPTKAKQMRFLQQRGFDAEQLRAVFDD